MSFKCKIGFHSWDGCMCTACGQTRDTGHDLTADCRVCSICGKTFEEDLHDWSGDCEKCARCGKTRENMHSWVQNCEKCSICGKTRSNMHRFKDGICQACGRGIYRGETDGTTYQIIKIGDQVVMAENFAGKPSRGNFWAYDDDESNRLKYGYLYDWEAARTLAPKGWHLPTKSEWEKLYAFLGGTGSKVYGQLKSGGKSGFESLFGGERYARGAFNSLGATAHYWSDTREDDKHVWQFKLSAYAENSEFKKVNPAFGSSVRLFRNK